MSPKASAKPKFFFSDNPEKLMIFLFPAITLALFIIGAIGWWAIRLITTGY